MQVTNSATIVDYFPEAFIAESDDIKGMKVVIKRFIKRVTFRANGMKSYSVVVATDAKNCAVGFHTISTESDTLDKTFDRDNHTFGGMTLSNKCFGEVVNDGGAVGDLHQVLFL